MESGPAPFWLTNRGVLTAAYMALMFSYIVTGAIGVPAHQYVRGYLDATPYQGDWYMEAYLLTCALMLTLVGNLKQRFGNRTISIAGPLLFSCGMFGASLALNDGFFITMRILQGVGAACCAAVGGGYLNGGIGKTNALYGKGLFVLTFAFGATSGIAISAAITWYISWRVLFAGIGLLLLVALSLIVRYAPDDGSDPSVPIDWLTFLLICGGFGLFAISLKVGNQHEWFQSPTYVVMLTISLVCMVCFFIRFAGSPPLVNPKVFSDINFTISTINLTLILFAVFLVLAIVPSFMVTVTGNTIASYVIPFAGFSIASVISIGLFAPAVNPYYFARTLSSRKVISSVGVFAFGITALWMAHTSSLQNNANLTLQLICLGFFFGFILLELLMCFATVPKELTTSASAINFFGTAIAKVFAGGVSGAIHTVSTQGSWERFRGLVTPGNEVITPFNAPFRNQILGGIRAEDWSQASLELINQEIARQAEVVGYVNVATLTGVLLLGFGILPFLHREGKAKASSRP